MEWVSGNIFIRTAMQMADAGTVNPGHTHQFDHTSIVFTGSVRVNATLPDGRRIERDFQAPAHFLVKAEVEHEITALEDGTTLWCVYSHRTPKGDVVQDYNGWRNSYV
jgi:L-ascorbate metabolism protein UlaG (beta-lactamase superfamily)